MQGLREFILHYCPLCETRINSLTHFNPNDWLGWVQLITSIIGVLWILYQFNKLREDAEAKLQEYLAKHLDKKRINAAAEREQMLDKLTAPRQTGLAGWSLYPTGQLWRELYFARRFVPFVDPPSHRNLALVWMAAGMDRKARDEFNEFGEELLRQAKLYEEEAKAKRIAAGNAYIFAGRLSAMFQDNEGAREAFQNMLSETDRNDLDAREQIVEQYIHSNAVAAAFEACMALKRLAKKLGARNRLARAYRLEAKISVAQFFPGKARSALEESVRIEQADGNMLGLATTYEQIGDLHAHRPTPNRKAAQDNYKKARDHYDVAGNANAASAVGGKLDAFNNLRPMQDTWLSRLLRRLAEAIQSAAERYRVPAGTLSA
jgi:hypothetical protein